MHLQVLHDIRPIKDVEFTSFLSCENSCVMCEKRGENLKLDMRTSPKNLQQLRKLFSRKGRTISRLIALGAQQKT